VINDSFQIDFPHFHSFIRFKLKNSDDIAGYWYNLNKAISYKIPFAASFGKPIETCKNDTKNDLSGRWKTKFNPDSKNEEIAIGIFKTDVEDYSRLTGTFLTETGDYRFLEGKVCNEEFYLSCFDGSHAFMFVGNIALNKISGTFLSGKHYKTTWKAEKDEHFELRNPDSITYIVKKEPFHFKIKDLEGKDFTFPNQDFNNKVTIIQIMGTWCPNCLDETKFLKEMYEKYNQKGLEIISIAYETPTLFEEQVEKINLLKKRLNLNHTFLVGGQANKSLASEQFSMLNAVVSFPTAIFINRKGEVEKVHTGFNGPGTGQIYLDYKLETEKFILDLLK
jgi:thiol-disulfide isomerase/thioredoxin